MSGQFWCTNVWVPYPPSHALLSSNTSLTPPPFPDRQGTLLDVIRSLITTEDCSKPMVYAVNTGPMKYTHKPHNFLVVNAPDPRMTAALELAYAQRWVQLVYLTDTQLEATALCTVNQHMPCFVQSVRWIEAPEAAAFEAVVRLLYDRGWSVFFVEVYNRWMLRAVAELMDRLAVGGRRNTWVLSMDSLLDEGWFFEAQASTDLLLLVPQVRPWPLGQPYSRTCGPLDPPLSLPMAGPRAALGTARLQCARAVA